MVTVPFDVNDAELRHTFLSRLLPDAINGLDEEARPAWEKMSAQHMVEHLAWAFELSTGTTEVTCKTPEKLLGRAKAFLHDNRPTPRGFKNPALDDEPPTLRYASLAEAKAALHAELSRFLDHFHAPPWAVHTHPIFGPLDGEEWERNHFKHSYHHLLQFGLIEQAGA